MRIILKSRDGFGSMVLHMKTGTDVKHECLIDTKGFCFICVKELIYEEGTPPPPPQSFDFVESHLGIAFNKWLVDSEFIIDHSNHPFLLKLNEKGVTYQAKLCSDCAKFTEALSRSCGGGSAGRGNELEVVSALRAIRNNIEESDKSDRMDEFYRQSMMSKPNPEQMQMAALTSIGLILRSDISSKCLSQANYLEEQLRMVTLAQQSNARGAGTTHIGKLAQGTVGTRRKASAQSAPDKEELSQRLQVNGSSRATSATPVIGTLNGNSGGQIGTITTSSETPQDSEPAPGHTQNPEASVGVSEEVDRSGLKLPTQLAPLTTKYRRSSRRAIKLTPTISSPVTRTSTTNSARVAKSTPGRSRPHRPDSKKSSKSAKTKLGTKAPQPGKPHECIFCLKRFASITHLEFHLRTHTRESPYFCHLCNFAGRRPEHLKAHLETHQPNRKRKFRCEFCPMKCFTAANLQHHQRIHKQECWIKCDSCPKRFKGPWDLKIHCSRMHAKESNVECKDCGKKFPDEFILSDHRRHAHGKRYSCKICKKTLSSKHNFKKHNNRVHSSKRKMPFKCEICAKPFHTKVEWQRHVKTHVDLAERPRPYQCDTCKKRFLDNWHLSKHKRVVHKKQKKAD